MVDEDLPGTGLTLRELRDRPLSDLKAVGPKLGERLATMGLATVLDMLEHYPRRYHDRTNIQEIADLAAGEKATVTGEVKKVSVRRPPGRRPIVEMEVFDQTSYLRLTFFNQEYRSRIAEGTEVSVFGTVELYRGRRQMVNPAIDIVGTRGRAEHRRAAPDLPAVRQGRRATAGRSARSSRSCSSGRSRGGSPIRSTAERDARGLADRSTAYEKIHRPATMAEAEFARGPAHLRRVPPHADRPRRAQAGVRAGAHRHRARRRRPAGARVPRAPAVPAHERPGAHHRRDREGHGRRRRRCTACSRARSAPARRSSRSSALLDGGRRRLPGRVHGADRGAGRATRVDAAGAPRRADRPRPATPCSASARCTWRCSRTARARPSAGASPRGSAPAPSTSWSARTR